MAEVKKEAVKKAPVKKEEVKPAAKKVETKPAVKKEVKAKVAKKVETDAERNLRKTRTGIVYSNKMQKTIVVQVESKSTHPLYGKIVKSTKKFKVHDEKNEAGVGDKVEIIETRPLSKEKYFRLLRIVEKAK
jgi:small subunit ribosomal protein S17